jgi:hypothetical protein
MYRDDDGDAGTEAAADDDHDHDHDHDLWQDERVVAPTVYQCFAPKVFLSREDYMSQAFGTFQIRRPMDAMKIKVVHKALMSVHGRRPSSVIPQYFLLCHCPPPRCFWINQRWLVCVWWVGRWSRRKRTSSR